MWNAILNVAGWLLFYLAILLYVRWVALERVYFAGQDPEAWSPGFQPDEDSSQARNAKLPVNFPRISSMGRPA